MATTATAGDASNLTITTSGNLGISTSTCTFDSTVSSSQLTINPQTYSDVKISLPKNSLRDEIIFYNDTDQLRIDNSEWLTVRNPDPMLELSIVPKNKKGDDSMDRDTKRGWAHVRLDAKLLTLLEEGEEIKMTKGGKEITLKITMTEDGAPLLYQEA